MRQEICCRSTNPSGPEATAKTMGDINFEANEDPLKDLGSHKVHEDEEDEEGAGVDYRRLFKGYFQNLYLPD